jgi:hypothetical protein
MDGPAPAGRVVTPPARPPRPPGQAGSRSSWGPGRPGRRHRRPRLPGTARHRARHGGSKTTSAFFYQPLHAIEVFPAAALPTTVRALSSHGQLSIEQLLERYSITCRPVREQLVDYLRERQPAVDYVALQRMAATLGSRNSYPSTSQSFSVQRTPSSFDSFEARRHRIGGSPARSRRT